MNNLIEDDTVTSDGSANLPEVGAVLTFAPLYAPGGGPHFQATVTGLHSNPLPGGPFVSYEGPSGLKGCRLLANVNPAPLPAAAEEEGGCCNV